MKLDPDAVAGSSSGPNAARAALVGFDWRSMERDVVTDLIVANLQHFNEEAVLAAISVSLSDVLTYELDGFADIFW